MVNSWFQHMGGWGKNHCKFDVNLGYIVISSPSGSIEQDSVLRKNNKQKEMKSYNT